MCGGLGIKNPDAGPNSRAGPSNSEVVFAADLGGTHLRAATVDENGQINFRLKQKTPQAGEPGEIVRALVLAVRQCETQSKISGDSIRAISSKTTRMLLRSARCGREPGTAAAPSSV